MRKCDIEIGSVFSHWTVLRDNGSNLDKKKVYWCRCDCGEEHEVLGQYLRDGRSTKCIKCNKPNKASKLSQDVIEQICKLYVNGGSSVEIGKQFGINLGTVLNYVKKSGYKTRDICEHGERCRKAPGVSAKNYVYKAYKSTAKHRGLDFCLSKDQFFELTERNCTYCGCNPSNKKELASGSWCYNGLDRVDSSKGYLIDNVTPCCIRCNMAKSDMTVCEFKNWITQVHNFFIMEDGKNALER